ARRAHGPSGLPLPQRQVQPGDLGRQADLPDRVLDRVHAGPREQARQAAEEAKEEARAAPQEAREEAPLRIRLGALALAAALAAAGLSAGAAPAAAKKKKHVDRNLTRAVLTYRALQKHYYVKGAKLYRGGSPSTYSFLWPFSQALSATISLDAVPGQSKHFARDVRDRLSGLGHYYDGRSTPPGYVGGALPPYAHGGTK